MKTAITLAGLALALGGLVGCGGDDDGGDSEGMPTNASSEEFCGNFEDLAKDLGTFNEDVDPAEAITAMQGASERMRETGVPENATDEQREGLEITLDAIDAIDEDATLQDLGSLEESFSDSEQEKADAFDDYLDEECGEIE